MATGLTDRFANRDLNLARVASNVDIALPGPLADQLDQRHVPIPLTVTATLTAGVTYRYIGWVADRAYRVISARLVSPAVITANTTNYTIVNVVWNNDLAGPDTVLATMNTSTTAVSAYQSVPLTVTTSNTIATTQQVDVVLSYSGTGTTLLSPAGTPAYIVDLVVQEV